MAGSPALDAFVKELLEKEAEWETELGGFKMMRLYVTLQDGVRAVEEMIDRYERRLALMGDGHTIQVDALIADGYPEMEGKEVSRETYDDVSNHILDQEQALAKLKIQEPVTALIPSGVQVHVNPLEQEEL